VKIDVNLLSDMMMGGSNSPSAQVVSILKPAALAYLEVESNLPSSDAENALEIKIDRSNMEFEFLLSQKSYALTINAVSALSSNRPVFFKEGAACMARRNADPPVFTEEGHLTKSAVLAVQSHIRASCLTLLRNALSVQTQTSQILVRTLEHSDMKIQAEKALKMAQQTNSLKTAGRAARNRANMFYEWDTSDQRTSKRQRETDDALAKMRAAKAARGLGQGIQLPISMADSIDLIVANLKHLPSKRPSSSSKRKTPATLDFVVDAVMTNGASLTQEEGRWYSRDGGAAWSSHMDGDTYYELSSTLLVTVTDDEEAAEQRSKQETAAIRDQKKMYRSQCKTAASEAVGRIVSSSLNSRDAQLSQLANQIAARLAWTLKGVPTPSYLKPAQDMALDTIQSSKTKLDDTKTKESLDKLVSSFPLVASCLVLEATSTISHGLEDGATKSSLGNSILNEAYAQACRQSTAGEDENPSWKYHSSLDLFTGSILHSSERANDKPTDNDRKRVASKLAASMQQDLGVLPALNHSSFSLIGAMCDIDEITKKATEADRKGSQQTIAASAALHAAKQAAEKRATAALLTLRDTAFQRSEVESRRGAVQTAVAVAAGNLNASKSCEDKALKMVMNVLFVKSESLANCVVDAAIAELKQASNYAVDNYRKIQAANAEAAKGNENLHQKNAFAPGSDEERLAMEKVRKPVMLFMALCIRRPDIIKTLFTLSSVAEADVLSKTVRQNMSKLARAAATKYGPASLALKVAETSSQEEVPLLLAFLENLTPVGDKNVPSQELIDACFQIQESKAEDGKKDPRFLIPIVCSMKRDELVERLPEFVQADNDVFMAALVKMGERLGRHQLLFRDEPEPETPQLKGLTLCEQLVFLHNLDFAAAGLPQKRYLDAIRLCLENDEVFNDRLIMSALDHMSGTFLTGEEKLPLAYMRTIILVCSKHESLHSWICHTLLPRLVEGKIYTDRRQWEGWMRCAKMLESNAGSGVSSAEAINQLPAEQSEMYRARYGS
jgi:symplekin